MANTQAQRPGGSIVRFGREAVDLARRSEPISHATFQSLMDEDPDKPFYAFARICSSGGKQKYAHLYSAENVIEWYPLNGRTDPCTRGSIERIEYYLYFKGEGGAVHVGDVYEDTADHVSTSADYLIWYHSGEDEPSRLLSLLAIAYLQNLGLINITSDDTFDTSSVARLGHQRARSLEQTTEDQAHGRTILEYIGTRIEKLIEGGELNCSDPAALLTSLEHDAAHHLADALVSQDPNVKDDGDDVARSPNVRKNALAAAIIACYGFRECGCAQATVPSER
mmetsp:Transcript_16578/g.32980  ORF Transcript_16578/g.32980 Transcript_16578/m.32980 type:complete len:281 (-) Transcript_16578:489-1331(-)